MIRLVSLNIERSKHLGLVIPFLQQQNADVVCLQELMEYDIPKFESALEMQYRFAAGKLHAAEGNPGILGEGIFSRLKIVHSKALYYHGSADHIPESDMTDVHTKHTTESTSVIFCDVESGDTTFRIATTHFTWTLDGRPNDYQREDLKKMIEILDGLGEFVLCGDFNAPRGGEIFSMIAKKYKDNIPLTYKTSIDVNLHRAGKIASEKMDEKMVDGLFSTPQYVVSDVELHSGVSDHLAVVATIARA